MANYKPSTPFNVPMWLITPTYENVKGSVKKVYPSENRLLIYCSFRTFGGTERTVNNLFVVEDTAIIETWYLPIIKADCILEDINEKRYEILGTPENINMRNQYLKFKIKTIRGGA